MCVSKFAFHTSRLYMDSLLLNLRALYRSIQILHSEKSCQLSNLKAKIQQGKKLSSLFLRRFFSTYCVSELHQNLRGVWRKPAGHYIITEGFLSPSWKHQVLIPLDKRTLI